MCHVSGPVHTLARDTDPTTDLSLPTLEIGNYLNCLKLRLQKQKLLWVLYYLWDFYWQIPKKTWKLITRSCGYNYNSFLDSDFSSDRKDSYFLTKYFYLHKLNPIIWLIFGIHHFQNIFITITTNKMPRSILSHTR